MKPDSALAVFLSRFKAEKGIPETNEALTALQTEFDAFKASTQENIAELTEALQVALLSVEATEKQRDELAAKLAEIETAKAQSEADAAAAKANARKEKIVAAVGTDRADAVFQATESLADSAFEAVLAAMTAASVAEAKSAMFSETGVSAEADASVADAPSQEMQILRQKYADSAAA